MAKAQKTLNRINSIQATQQVTQALKIIATTKLEKVKKKLTSLLAYTSEFVEIFENIAFAKNHNTPLSKIFESKSPKSILITFFTTNRGFCGNINKQVCKQVQNLYQHYTAKNIQVTLLPIGKKAINFLSKNNLPYNPTCKDCANPISLSKAHNLAKFFLSTFQHQDRILLIYPYNTNVLEQKIKTRQLLPIKPRKSLKNKPLEVDCIYEPSREAIIKDMIPTLITLTLYQILLQASQAEHTARNNAMTKATDNADNLLQELRIAYNRTRQTAITRQIIEIAASAEALKKA